MTEEIRNKLFRYKNGEEISSSELVAPLESLAKDSMIPYDRHSLNITARQLLSYVFDARRFNSDLIINPEDIAELLYKAAQKQHLVTPEKVAERLCTYAKLPANIKDLAFHLIEISQNTELKKLSPEGLGSGAVYTAAVLNGTYFPQREAAYYGRTTEVTLRKVSKFFDKNRDLLPKMDSVPEAEIKQMVNKNAS